MAIRAALARRFLCTSSSLSSQSNVYSASTVPNSHRLNNKAPPSKTLFVFGLNKETEVETLFEAFSKFGEVEEVKLARDHSTGWSKGYGFVTYSNLDDADRGLEGMGARILDGWVIFTEYAWPKLSRGQEAPAKSLIPFCC